MKKLLFCIGFAIFIVSSSCSPYLFPLGKTAKRAYKNNLKDRREDYTRFTAIELPADSLNAQQWTAPSPNFDVRTPNLVIIHHTAEESCQQSLRTLTDPNRRGRVSAHYLICKDGSVYRLVNEHYRAWQAGLSRWGNMQNINSLSLGIELDNNGHEPFSGPLIHSLLVLLKSIQTRYNIPTGNFVGHSDIAPTRKVDPSVYFPWETLARHGFGYQKDRVLPAVPEHFDDLAALRLIGYDVRDTAAAVAAFKRHYIQADVSPNLRPFDRRVLYDIYLKSLHYGD